MARPAASSAARLIRKPLDNRSSDLFNRSIVRFNCRVAFRAGTLVFIRKPIVCSSLIESHTAVSLPRQIELAPD
jgi:hypothetical protein